MIDETLISDNKPDKNLLKEAGKFLTVVYVNIAGFALFGGAVSEDGPSINANSLETILKDRTTSALGSNPAKCFSIDPAQDSVFFEYPATFYSLERFKSVTPLLHSNINKKALGLLPVFKEVSCTQGDSNVLTRDQAYAKSSAANQQLLKSPDVTAFQKEIGDKRGTYLIGNYIYRSNNAPAVAL